MSNGNKKKKKKKNFVEANVMNIALFSLQPPREYLEIFFYKFNFQAAMATNQTLSFGQNSCVT